jgi:hypothetical protein
MASEKLKRTAQATGALGVTGAMGANVLASGYPEKYVGGHVDPKAPKVAENLDNLDPNSVTAPLHSGHVIGGHIDSTAHNIAGAAGFLLGTLPLIKPAVDYVRHGARVFFDNKSSKQFKK